MSPYSRADGHTRPRLGDARLLGPPAERPANEARPLGNLGQIQKGRTVEHRQPHPAVGVAEERCYTTAQQPQPAKPWGIDILSPYFEDQNTHRISLLTPFRKEELVIHRNPADAWPNPLQHGVVRRQSYSQSFE